MWTLIVTRFKETLDEPRDSYLPMRDLWFEMLSFLNPSFFSKCLKNKIWLTHQMTVIFFPNNFSIVAPRPSETLSGTDYRTANIIFYYLRTTCCRAQWRLAELKYSQYYIISTHNILLLAAIDLYKANEQLIVHADHYNMYYYYLRYIFLYKRICCWFFFNGDLYICICIKYSSRYRNNVAYKLYTGWFFFYLFKRATRNLCIL